MNSPPVSAPLAHSNSTAPGAASPVPSLAAVLAFLPAVCLRPATGPALLYLAVSLVEVGLATAFAYFVYTRELYVLWPVSWLLGGVAGCSFFVLGHDCGHFSFLKNRTAMIILGHVLLAPLLYPFYAWKYSHDAHHKHTNRLKRSADIYFDNAWIPETVTEHRAERKNAPVIAWLYRMARRVLPFGSLLHLPGYLYDPRLFRPEHRRRVWISYAVVATTALGLGIGLSFAFGSLLAPLHFWILPALSFQIWMSLYTFLHHTAEDVPFYEDSEWNAFTAQMRSTINIRFPRVLSFLHFNIDVHIPHHIAPGIPGYRLRAANAALQTSPYGPMMRELDFSFAYVWRQVRRCQLWNPLTKRYVRFSETR